MPRAIVSKSGESILGNQNGRVTVIGNADAPPVSFQTHEKSILALACSPDGRTIATGCVDGSLRLWHRHTGIKLAELVPSGPQVIGLAFSPDGRCLASCDHSGDVRLWSGLPE